MIPTFVIAVALAVGADEPVPVSPVPRDAVPTYPAPGARFGIPCKVATLPPEVVGVELWFSDNGGKAWAKSSRLRRDESQFEFRAPKAGEYLFATRFCFKDGSVNPQRDEELAPEIRVVVRSVSERQEKQGRASAIVEELDDELTRVELELIRKELKNLSESKGFSPKTEEEIDRLRARLLQARERLRQDREPETGSVVPSRDRTPDYNSSSATIPQALPPVPPLPPSFGPTPAPRNAGSRVRFPIDFATPEPLPPPVAPMPHAPERP